MKYTILVMLFAVSFFCSGCRYVSDSVSERPVIGSDADVLNEPAIVVDQTSAKMQKRFDPAMQDQGDSEKKTLELARSYEELSVKANVLRETNSKLFQENNQLKEQVEDLKTELEQAKKDMAEANDFLGQMHLELNKWKSDVLGFREEIRQAQSAQLEALGNILLILGAEPVTVSETQDENSSGLGETE